MSALRAWTVSVGLLLATTAVNAQGLPSRDTGRGGYMAASDFAGPFADAPPEAPPPVIYGPRGYGPPPRDYGPTEYGPGYGAALMPPREVYAVLRENGFQPLGAPRLRGLFYSISAIDRRGDDGHLVIDARDGRIVRFMPAEHFGGYGSNGDGYFGAPPPRPSYGGPLEPMSRLDGAPPPATPKVASRSPSSVPMPKAAPSRPASDQPPLVAKPTLVPAPVQQSAAAQTKPADIPPTAPPAATAEAKPAPVIQPTQPMPKVQDFE
jgi:hypothetical protein